jgi:hypothetical protein
VVEEFNAGGRLAMFLAFHEIFTSFKEFQPLSLVTHDLRVDLQTGVWLFGKSLRLIDFLYRVGGTANGMVVSGNTLVDTDRHAVFMFDFSQAIENPTEGVHLSEVSQAARMVLVACGGDDEKDPPYDVGIMSLEHHDEYVEFLRRTIEDPQPAQREHKELYDLANRIWPKVPAQSGGLKRPFYPFCTYPR